MNPNAKRNARRKRMRSAREFAASILEDVNDHDAAAMVRKLTTDEKAAEEAQS